MYVNDFVYFFIVYLIFVLNCYENVEIINIYVNDVRYENSGVVEIMISGYISVID